jgi:hypothetical protein
VLFRNELINAAKAGSFIEFIQSRLIERNMNFISDA